MKDGVAYAGTEHGLYVTFDAGRRWQSMQLNLITPIADMRVHRNDLVVATQGRSIWILDDLYTAPPTGRCLVSAGPPL